MSTKKSNPVVWKKVIECAIAVLTAIAGFLSGIGAHAATSVLF